MAILSHLSSSGLVYTSLLVAMAYMKTAWSPEVGDVESGGGSTSTRNANIVQRAI